MRIDRNELVKLKTEKVKRHIKDFCSIYSSRKIFSLQTSFNSHTILSIRLKKCEFIPFPSQRPQASSFGHTSFPFFSICNKEVKK